MPLQHGSRSTLLRMKRPAKIEWVYETLEKMRARIPNLAVRTTFIVGYPGETDAEFEELCNFVRDLRFDRVGAFKYSFEEGTPSATQANHLPDEVKDYRWNTLMELQQNISLQKNQELVGKTLDVLVEGYGEAENEHGKTGQRVSLARSYRDAPEIDGYVLVEGHLPVGEIVPVRVTGATTYDLIASPDLAGPMVIQPGQVISEGMINLDEVH
jgi:ribosomal protein S12 methylthiotransferase